MHNCEKICCLRRKFGACKWYYRSDRPPFSFWCRVVQSVTYPMRHVHKAFRTQCVTYPYTRRPFRTQCVTYTRRSVPNTLRTNTLRTQCVTYSMRYVQPRYVHNALRTRTALRIQYVTYTPARY